MQSKCCGLCPTAGCAQGAPSCAGALGCGLGSSRYSQARVSPAVIGGCPGPPACPLHPPIHSPSSDTALSSPVVGPMSPHKLPHIQQVPPSGMESISNANPKPSSTQTMLHGTKCCCLLQPHQNRQPLLPTHPLCPFLSPFLLPRQPLAPHSGWEYNKEEADHRQAAKPLRGEEGNPWVIQHRGWVRTP